jgi:hypothetical protein
MSGGAKHVCYYSTRCPFSQAFLEELSRTPYSKEFRFVCVDPVPGKGRPALPPEVKAVPMIKIDGEAEYRKDSNVMNWLSERRLRDSSTGPGVGAGDGGLTPFFGEMCGLGDESFCYIGEDTSASQSAMVRLTGNMASISDTSMTVPDSRVFGGAQTARTHAVPSEMGPKQSAKAKALDDAFTAFQKSREMDLPGPRQRI